MGTNQEQTPGDETRDDVVETVARISERILPVASVGLSAAAAAGPLASASAGGIGVTASFVAAAGVTGLLPIAFAFAERRVEARSERATRARAYADAAWDAIVAAREG